MKRYIEQIINGRYCPECKNSRFYKLSDRRIRCTQCGFKLSPNKLSDDLTLLHYFSLEIPANKAAKDLGFGYNKVHRRYMQYRKDIFKFLDREYQKLSGEIECDESYFGGKRKGQRGRGAKGKVIVFGMLERQGRIFTTIIHNVKAKTLMNNIKKHSQKGSVFYTDTFKSYKSLTFYGKHIEVDHEHTFVKGRRHINGLEGFWSFAKERLLKYHGVSKTHFLLYLKEMEFRYNYRKDKIFDLLIKIHFSPLLN